MKNHCHRRGPPLGHTGPSLVIRSKTGGLAHKYSPSTQLRVTRSLRHDFLRTTLCKCVRNVGVLEWHSSSYLGRKLTSLAELGADCVIRPARTSGAPGRRHFDREKLELLITAPQPSRSFYLFKESACPMSRHRFRLCVWGGGSDNSPFSQNKDINTTLIVQKPQ